MFLTNMQATSVVLKKQEAVNFLEKKMQNDPELSYDETMHAERAEVLLAIRQVTSSLSSKEFSHNTEDA
ncbi:hypothetical protein Tco_1239251, partial [Tanacetum coccineum]